MLTICSGICKTNASHRVDRAHCRPTAWPLDSPRAQSVSPVLSCGWFCRGHIANHMHATIPTLFVFDVHLDVRNTLTISTYIISINISIITIAVWIHCPFVSAPLRAMRDEAPRDNKRTVLQRSMSCAVVRISLSLNIHFSRRGCRGCRAWCLRSQQSVHVRLDDIIRRQHAPQSIPIRNRRRPIIIILLS